MDAVTLSKPEVKAFMNRFSFAKLDYFANKQEIASFNVGFLPVVVFLTPDNKEIKRLQGFYSVDAFVQELQSVLATTKKSADSSSKPPDPVATVKPTAEVKPESAWLTTLADGKKQAAATNKPLFLKVGALW